MTDMGKVAEEIKKHGIEFVKYLGRRRQDGLLPLARVVFKGTKQAPPVFTEAELDAVVQKARAEDMRMVGPSSRASPIIMDRHRAIRSPRRAPCAAAGDRSPCRWPHAGG
jgi:hypothetical protein